MDPGCPNGFLLIRGNARGLGCSLANRSHEVLYSAKTQGGLIVKHMFSYAALRRRSFRLGALLLGSLCCLLLMGSGVPLGAQPELDPEAVQALLDRVMERQLEEHHVPGVTVSAVHDGAVVAAAGYGYADVDREIPVDPDTTLFRIGSVSKIVTWTAVMQLVEAGRIDLDADINTYLDFAIPAELWRGSGETPGPITMRHLMTHRPGFEDVGENLFVLSPDRLVPLETYLKEHVPARVFAPGEVLAYSNYGSALAGYIVQRVARQTFDNYVEEHIFGPLGMTHSSFRQPLPSALEGDLANAYKFVDDAYHRGGFEYIPPAPAGSMSASARDMAHFMLAHLQDGGFGEEQILLPETAQEMHRQQFTQHPQLDGVTLGFFEMTVNDRRVLGHNGATMLFFSQLALVPEEGFGFFVSYSGGVDAAEVMQLGEKVFQALMDEFFPGEGEPPIEPAAGARERALAYVGEYHPTRMSFTGPEKFLGLLQAVPVQVADDGTLLVGFGADMQEFDELEPGVYQNRNLTEGPRRVAFIEDDRGEPLLAVGAGSFFKAPAYATLPVLASVTVLSLGMLVLTLSGWLIVGFARRLSRRRRHQGSGGLSLPRVLAVLYGLVTLAFFAGMVRILTDIEPAYGVPNLIFGEIAPVMELVFYLPLISVVLGAFVVLSAVVAWVGRFWSLLGRLHYTLVALAVLGLSFVFWTTNLL